MRARGNAKLGTAPAFILSAPMREREPELAMMLHWHVGLVPVPGRDWTSPARVLDLALYLVPATR